MNAINCKKIEYHIVYGKIKNLYIQVKDGQVIVKAPKYLSKKDIYNILDKKIFLEFYYSGKTIKDIAKEQNITTFSVKQRLYRIRNKIKKEEK